MWLAYSGNKFFRVGPNISEKFVPGGTNSRGVQIKHDKNFIAVLGHTAVVYNDWFRDEGTLVIGFALYFVLSCATHCVGQGDLKSLHCELHPVSDKWFSLGVKLQVPIEALKCIKTEHCQTSRRLLEMLTVWLKCTNPPPTWTILTEALKSPPVGERLLAQQLRDKYCPPTERRVARDCGLSPPVALPTFNITSNSDSQPETALTPPTEQMVPTRRPSVAHIQDCK